jgi:acetoin utilization deacetylase AcuC-like enzyme
MRATPVFLEHPSSLQHDTGSHPEQPARITAIQRELHERDWLGYERLESPPVDRDVLLRVHPESYVASIEAVSARGGGHLDLDTVMSEASFDAALHAAGGAVRLVELLVTGETPTGFSSHRPPGHHASAAKAMGFCLFNNIAVAARHAIDGLGLRRVLILDWDVHHGNGTNDIFYEDHDVLFISIHQYPLYPGTGRTNEAGAGPGLGYTVNLPVPPGSGDATYTSLVRDVVSPLARAYEPELVLLSAGYDAHVEDPLAECHVTDDGFAAVARLMRSVCADELEVPLGAVLEGGYALGALARGVAVTLEALSGAGETGRAGGAGGAGRGGGGLDGGDVPVATEAQAALERLAEFWPQL